MPVYLLEIFDKNFLKTTKQNQERKNLNILAMFKETKSVSENISTKKIQLI